MPDKDKHTKLLLVTESQWFQFPSNTLTTTNWPSKWRHDLLYETPPSVKTHPIMHQSYSMNAESLLISMASVKCQTTVRMCCYRRISHQCVLKNEKYSTEQIAGMWRESCENALTEMPSRHSTLGRQNWIEIPVPHRQRDAMNVSFPMPNYGHTVWALPAKT